MKNPVTGVTDLVRAINVRAINPAPFGRHSRYMLSGYLRHIFMVAAALSVVALAIDLWPQVPLLSERNSGPMLGLAVAKLAVLRIFDLLPPFIPFAAFLGVVWSEVAFTESRERMLIWNSGRSPLQCLAPAVMAGLLMGVLVFVMDGFGRPAAMAVQIAETFGREGVRLDRSQSGGSHWIAIPNGLLRAEIEFGPPPRLHNATIYKLDTLGHLSEVDTALSATPTGQGDDWLLEKGHFWKENNVAQGGTFSTATVTQEQETPFAERVITVPLNLLWLGNIGMSPQYLSFTDLRALAHAKILAPDAAGFPTRLQALYSEILLTVAMALLAASLCMLLFAYRISATRLILVLLAGYLAHFAVRAFLLMGEFGYVGAVTAGWAMPIFILMGMSGVLYAIQVRRGLAAMPGLMRFRGDPDN